MGTLSRLDILTTQFVLRICRGKMPERVTEELFYKIQVHLVQ